LTKKLALFIVIILVLFTGTSTFLSSNLKFDYNFEHFFPQNDPDLEFFLDYRDTYENDNDYVLISIGEQQSIFNKEFLNKADRFTNDLKTLNHIEKVISPTQIKQPIFNEFGFVELPIIHLNKPELFISDSTKIYNSKEYTQSFFSKDFNSICIVIHNSQIITKKASDELLSDIENLLEEYNFKDVHYAGKIRGQKEYLNKMKTEISLFLIISIALIVILLFFTFRSIFGIIVPIITVLMAIIIVLAIMYVSGKSLDVMSSLLPTILFVVGMSDAVHILSKYIEELRRGSPKFNAIKTTFKEIGWATLLTSITTAIGFITLMIINIKPVKDFGLYAAIGVMVAFTIAILLLPALLTLIKEPKLSKSNSRFWSKYLSQLFIIVTRSPKRIIGIYGFIFITSLIGITQLKIDSRILEDLSEQNILQQDFRFFENQYTGIRPFEMSISVVDTSLSVLDYRVIQEMNKVDDYLYNEYNAGFIISPITLFKTLNKAAHSGNNKFYKIPSSKKEHLKLLKKLKRANINKRLEALIRKDFRACRFTGKMDDIGSNNAKKLNDSFSSFFSSKVDTNIINYKMTGTALLIDKNNEILSVNIISGLSIAFLFIAIIIGILYKSFKMALISLIPNVIPLTIIAGVMGFVGTNINISTSIVFTIAFGIAVDDTIHFLSRYKLELEKNKPKLFALKRTYLSTGKAILLTTLILCGGFVSLMFSDFKSTFLIGIYVTLILFVAVITDLILLPVLLMIFHKRD